MHLVNGAGHRGRVTQDARQTLKRCWRCILITIYGVLPQLREDQRSMPLSPDERRL